MADPIHPAPRIVFCGNHDQPQLLAQRTRHRTTGAVSLPRSRGDDLSHCRPIAATSLATLVAMVDEGLGITLLPQLAIDAGITQGHDIALVPTPGAMPRKVVMIWRRSSPRAPGFLTLAAALRRRAARPD